MRLVEAKSIEHINPPAFKEIFDSADKDHQYIILSHRWTNDELTYQQVSDKETFWDQRIFNKEGYKKLRQFARTVYHHYGVEWIWCDTCCIDKENPAELGEAINSMYRWYADSKACFAYLADWPGEVSVFTESVWFTRCWTLQELIAPKRVVFYDCEWRARGSKTDLEFAEAISRRTRIDTAVLRVRQPLDRFSIAQRMSWASGRTASRKEDEAYCLLGIFGVSMPMLYGEGENAFLRLQENIIQRNADQSIFVWSSREPSRNLLASSAADFADTDQVYQSPRLRCPFSLNNLGLEIELELRQIKTNTYAAYLACEYIEPANAVSLILEYEPGTSYFHRIQSNFPQLPEESNRELRKTRKITIHRNGPSTLFTTRPMSSLYGFCLGGNCQSLLLVNGYDQRGYWDHGKWLRDSQDPPRHPPIFTIPEGEAPSIASMILFIGKTRLLVQLMYDFDFRPCCYVSKHTQSAGPVFYLRSSGESRCEERMAWLDDDHPTSGWVKEPSYMEMDKKHPYTDEPGWAAKSLHRGGFTARIPRALTRPYRDVEVLFSPHRETGNWIFDVSHEQAEVGLTFSNLGFPIVQGSSDLQNVLGDLGLDEASD